MRVVREKWNDTASSLSFSTSISVCVFLWCFDTVRLSLSGAFLLLVCPSIISSTSGKFKFLRLRFLGLGGLTVGDLRVRPLNVPLSLTGDCKLSALFRLRLHVFLVFLTSAFFAFSFMISSNIALFLFASFLSFPVFMSVTFFSWTWLFEGLVADSDSNWTKCVAFIPKTRKRQYSETAWKQNNCLFV